MEITDSRIKSMATLARLRVAIAEGEEGIKKIDEFHSYLEKTRRESEAKRESLLLSLTTLRTLYTVAELDSR